MRQAWFSHCHWKGHGVQSSEMLATKSHPPAGTWLQAHIQLVFLRLKLPLVQPRQEVRFPNTQAWARTRQSAFKPCTRQVNQKKPEKYLQLSMGRHLQPDCSLSCSGKRNRYHLLLTSNSKAVLLGSAWQKSYMTSGPLPWTGSHACSSTPVYLSW